jgi:hypothetical protein
MWPEINSLGGFHTGGKANNALRMNQSALLEPRASCPRQSCKSASNR